MSRECQPPTPQVLAWVARQVHPRGRVTAVARLLGGITADTDRITVELPAGGNTVGADVVLRRWPEDEQEQTAALVTREAAALTAVHDHGVPAPRLLAIDEDGTETGAPSPSPRRSPASRDLAPVDPESWLTQLATTQAAIHAVPGRLQPKPDRYAARDRPLEWLVDPGLRAAAREAAAGPPAAATVLVHGDYQHFNLLWSAGRLTGVVDWPGAGTGSRGTDLGHCRLNLAVLFGADTAVDYLTRYERAAGGGVDRRADLRALLCFDLDWREFIPRQVAGRAHLNVAAMPDRVADTVRRAVDAIVEV